MIGNITGHHSDQVRGVHLLSSFNSDCCRASDNWTTAVSGKDRAVDEKLLLDTLKTIPYAGDCTLTHDDKIPSTANQAHRKPENEYAITFAKAKFSSLRAIE